jgi:hypothetical protein
MERRWKVLILNSVAVFMALLVCCRGTAQGPFATGSAIASCFRQLGAVVCIAAPGDGVPAFHRAGPVSRPQACSSPSSPSRSAGSAPATS